MGSSWGPPGSCRPKMGSMLAPWTLLSGNTYGMVLSSFKTLWNCICLLAILKIYVVHKSLISPFVYCVWISLYIFRVVTSLDMKITLTSQHLKSPVTQLDRLFNQLFRQTSKPAFQALCEGYPSVVDGFPSQKASNAVNISMSWRYHDIFHWSTHPNMHPFEVHPITKKASKWITMLCR